MLIIRSLDLYASRAVDLEIKKEEEKSRGHRARRRFLFGIVDVSRIEASASLKRVALKKRNASTAWM